MKKMKRPFKRLTGYPVFAMYIAAVTFGAVVLGLLFRVLTWIRNILAD